MTQPKAEKIIFLMGSRYPSNKAYAITTGRTAQALTRINGHEAEIWCQYSEKSDEYCNKIKVPSYYSIASFLWRLNNVKFTSVGYVIGCLFLTRYFAKNFKSDLFSANVITREIYQACFLLMRGHKKITLEIHHVPKGRISKLLLRTLFNRVKAIIVLYASQKDLLVDLGCPERRIHVLPMGVPEEFFISENVQKNANEVVFLGRMNSSGVDSNLRRVIVTMSSVNLIKNEEIVLKLIGVSREDLSEISSLEGQNQIDRRQLNVEIIPNVDHMEVPKLLQTSTIGLVPYTKDDYNLERFPIKILEYAASRNLIVATEVYKMNGLLNEERAIFFDPESTDSFANAFNRALNEDNLYRVNAAQEWAKNYTYAMRASRLQRLLEEGN